MNKIKTIKDIKIEGKNVFLRVDYNVTLDDKGNVLNDFRIKSGLLTLKEILKKKPKKIIIATHLGRPEGKEARFSTKSVAERLMKLCGRPVEHIPDCINVLEEIEESDAQIVVLENLRYYPEEKKNDPVFAKKLADPADVFINDAFGVCHRAHASVHAITTFIPGAIGPLVEKELKVFDEALSVKDKKLVVVLGGSKLETKIPLLKNLILKANRILLGGAMIFTFYKAKGYDTGKSLVDRDAISFAKILLNNDNLILPEDIVIADDMNHPTNILTVKPNYVPAYMIGLDIGEKTIKTYLKELDSADIVIWNGPLGYYENKEFATGTNAIIKKLAHHEGKVIIGGGDTASMIEQLGLVKRFHHVSTGGGASLKLLEGGSLPALEALSKAK